MPFPGCLLYNKFGLDRLSFYVIEYCQKGFCREREFYYINTLHPEINIAYTPFQFEGSLDEYRAKVVKAQKDWAKTDEGLKWNKKRLVGGIITQRKGKKRLEDSSKFYGIGLTVTG